MLLVLVLVILLLLTPQFVASVFSMMYKIIVFILKILLKVIWTILKYILRFSFSCLGCGRRGIRGGMTMRCYSILYVYSIPEYNHRAQVQYPLFPVRVQSLRVTYTVLTFYSRTHSTVTQEVWPRGLNRLLLVVGRESERQWRDLVCCLPFRVASMACEIRLQYKGDKHDEAETTEEWKVPITARI